MAVYAAYRHIELDNVGCGKKRASKPPGGESHDLFGAEFKGTPCHHRVLKPPGGGTSDIFGAPEPLQNSPRRAHNKMQSSVFGPSNGDANLQTRNKPGNDSYNRLFGPADSSRPGSAVKDRLKSHIMLSTGEPSSPTKDKNSYSPVKETISTVDAPLSPKASMPRRNPVTGDGMYVKEIRRSARKRDGNPVTGEGYNNGNKQPAASASTTPTSDGTNGTTNGTNGTSVSHSAPPQRQRVPPGGYSSGLW